MCHHVYFGIFERLLRETMMNLGLKPSLAEALVCDDIKAEAVLRLLCNDNKNNDDYCSKRDDNAHDCANRDEVPRHTECK